MMLRHNINRRDPLQISDTFRCFDCEMWVPKKWCTSKGHFTTKDFQDVRWIWGKVNAVTP